PGSQAQPTVAASPGNDRLTLSVYDEAGRPRATVDAMGNVTAVAYDGVGNVVKRVAYAVPLLPSQITALAASPTWSALSLDLSANAAANPNAPDRISYTLYGSTNAVGATIDPLGDVTVY